MIYGDIGIQFSQIEDKLFTSRNTNDYIEEYNHDLRMAKEIRREGTQDQTDVKIERT